MSSDGEQAAVVCVHVAHGAPIRAGVREPPIEEHDSGWQFHCGRDHPDAEGAQVWSLADVLRRDASLAPFLERRPPTQLILHEGAWTEIALA